MKKNYKRLDCFSALLLSLCLLGSCTNYIDDSVVIISNTEQALTTKSSDNSENSICDEDLQKIASLGIDVTNIQDFGDYYIAENQFLIYKSTLLSLTENNTRALSTNNSLHPHKYKLYYKISSILDNTDNLLVEDGIMRWNDISDCGLDIECGTLDNNVHQRYNVDLSISNQFSKDTPLLTCLMDLETFPYPIFINTNNPLWSKVEPTQHSYTFRYFIMHAVGESLGINSNDTFDIYDWSIMADENLLNEKGDELWCDFSGQDHQSIASFFPETNIQFSYQWNPTVETYLDHYMLNANEEYNLTISSPAQCCNSSVNTYFCIEIENIGNTNASYSVNTIDQYNGQFSLSFDGCGEFLITTWVHDYINTRDISKLHEQTFYVYVLEDELNFTPTNEVSLNTPYNIQYNYWNPRYHNITFEYYAEEVLFDNDDSNIQLTPTNDGCTINIAANGSYFVTCIAKSGNTEVARRYCNVTRMPLADSLKMVRVLANSSIDRESFSEIPDDATNITMYDYRISFPNNNIDGRISYLVEAEIEHQFSYFYPPEPVIKQRHFHLDYHTFECDALTGIHYLPRMGWWIDQQIDELNFEGHLQYYTGYIYAYSTGVREVESISLDEIPVRVLRDPNIDGHTPDIMRSRTPNFDIE